MRVLDLNIPSINIHALTITLCSFLPYLNKESASCLGFRDIRGEGDIGPSLGLSVIFLTIYHALPPCFHCCQIMPDFLF